MNEEQIRKLATNYGLNQQNLNQFTNLSKGIVDQYTVQENDLNNQYNQLYNQYNQNIKDTKDSAIKAGQGAYQNFAKITNPYGLENEQRFKVGLGNSGLAESSMIGANNSYQNAITETTTNRDRMVNDINTKINQAKESKDINLMKIANERMTSILDQLNKFKTQQIEEERYQKELALAKTKSSGSSINSIDWGDNGGNSNPTNTQNSKGPTFAQRYTEALIQNASKQGAVNIVQLGQELAKYKNSGQITGDEFSQIINAMQSRGLVR